jgi:two-component system chemotaxis response regulator CheY
MDNSPEEIRTLPDLEVIEALLGLLVTREQEISELSKRVEELENLAKVGHPGYAKKAQNVLSPKENRKILVADQSEHVRKGLIDVLVTHGYTVVAEAENGVRAVQLFERIRPGYVTMDIEMPLLDGIEATRQIKAIDASVKVIIISRMLQREIIVRALYAGATEFLAKPVQIGRLLSVFDRLMN